MEYTVPGWVKVANRIEKDDESRGISFIYSKINADEINRNYEASYFRTLDVEKLSPMMMGAILTITFASRHNYEFREEFFDRCINSIKERCPDDIEVLDGLDGKHNGGKY